MDWKAFPADKDLVNSDAEHRGQHHDVVQRGHGGPPLPLVNGLGGGEIESVIERLEQQQQSFVRYKKSRLEIQGFINEIGYDPREPKITVKDMPPFDPDAEIIALSLTIPSWIGSVERIKKGKDLNAITQASW